MDVLINAGFFASAFDLTTELADEIVGACDMVNFGSIDTVPEKFSGRNFYKHNPTVTLMRTFVDECKQIAEKRRLDD